MGKAVVVHCVGQLCVCVCVCVCVYIEQYLLSPGRVVGPCIAAYAQASNGRLGRRWCSSRHACRLRTYFTFVCVCVCVCVCVYVCVRAWVDAYLRGAGSPHMRHVFIVAWGGVGMLLCVCV